LSEKFPPQHRRRQPAVDTLEEIIPKQCDRTFRANIHAYFYLRRAAQPSEIAPSSVFLASSDASYITGQVIHPNGGTIVNGSKF
jgi:NAD(P)-dependent dehydrogenase (short-subunit alcohol dehydrogenase family)